MFDSIYDNLTHYNGVPVFMVPPGISLPLLSAFFFVFLSEEALVVLVARPPALITLPFALN